jgi:hypothetical protein
LSASPQASVLAIGDRLWEVPYRIRSPVWAKPGVDPDLQGVTVDWPAPPVRPRLYAIIETLEAGLAAVARMRFTDAAQRFDNMVIGTVSRGGRRCRFAVDFADRSERVEPAALAEVDVYFKLQYRRGGYGDAKIVSGGFVASSLDFYRYLPALRPLAAAPNRRVVFARFGFRYQAELRKQVLSMLGDAGGIDFIGAGGKVRYSRFLREAARSQLAVDLPGNGAFCHRLGLEHENEMPVPIEAGVHYVAFKRDLSDMVELCHRYVEDHAARDRIATAGRAYFDRYLHPASLARHYLRVVSALLS